MHRIWLIVTILLFTSGRASAGDAPLVITGASGQDVKLKTWRITTGVRRLPIGDGKGPRYLEFRDDHSTTYQAGILTLVPIPSLRRIDYDTSKKTITAVVATAGKDTTLTGTTKYQGINRITIEGDTDLGELGSASVKFQGGTPKGIIRSVRFPMPEPLPAFKGATAVVVGADQAKTRHEIAEPTALYQLPGGGARLVPQLHFKKTVKIELAKIVGLRHVEAEDKKQTSYDFEVTLADGAKHTLTLLTKVDLQGAKGATFVGILGRVATGYQLFPAHTIAEFSRLRVSGSPPPDDNPQAGKR